MASHISSHSGSPLPLGATPMAGGINFALFCRHAESVQLVIDFAPDRPIDANTKFTEISLDNKLNKTGDIWHIFLECDTASLRYGYRIDGPFEPDTSGHRYDGRLILLDPYAKMLQPSAWSEERPYLGKRPCCLFLADHYHWEGDRPLNTPLRDTIIYELHVRGFTCHPDSGVKQPGTFRGIVEKIPYLRELGITAVELMPVTEFNENESTFINPLTKEHLKNYWGYSPLSFFAPKSGYCPAGTNPLDEFRDMVKALHRAGIEVILDMVFNHTAEGGDNGPTTSFRGIDNAIYYLLDPWTRTYLNFSGCGNTFNCNHPIVRSLIMDALHWWVIEMHVDGFRFDLASILGRDQQGHVLSNPPMVEQIAEDPILSNSKIIAEAWDAAGLYQVGSFSTHRRWAEWNGRFRDDIRAFIRGDEGLVPALATRVAGSSDLYQHSNRQPCNSINFLTSHDGFTLLDLVSYNEKHNLANGEGNRDGDNHNLSWNSGVEGDSDDPRLLALRWRRLKTMAVILFVSQGVPMLVAGDEFGRSQQGNNNAYCQDNEISWLNWQLTETNHELLRFFRYLIALRRQHPVFRRKSFFVHHNRESIPLHRHEIIWQAHDSGVDAWEPGSKTLAFTLNGSASAETEDDDFFIMLSGHRKKSEIFTVPKPPTFHADRTWKKIINTAADTPHDAVDLDKARLIQAGARLTVPAMTCIVLQSVKKRTTSGKNRQ